MASRAGALRPPVGAALAAALLGAMTLGTVAVVVANAGAARPGVADWAAVRFTVTQAALSAVISGLLAVPVARALARRRFAHHGPVVWPGARAAVPMGRQLHTCSTVAA